MTSNQIVEYAFSLADESNDNLIIDNDELELFLNGAYLRIYKRIANLQEDYYTVSYSDTIKEHGEIDLPKDFYLLKRIDVNNEIKQLEETTESEIDLHEYKIIDNKHASSQMIFNKQMAGKNIKIYYVPGPAWIPLSDNPWADSVTSGALDHLAYSIAMDIAFKRGSNNLNILRVNYLNLINSFTDILEEELK